MLRDRKVFVWAKGYDAEERRRDVDLEVDELSRADIEALASRGVRVARLINLFPQEQHALCLKSEMPVKLHRSRRLTKPKTSVPYTKQPRWGHRLRPEP